MAIVGYHHGDDGDLSLDSQMESALLERQKLRLFAVAPGTLGEHVYTLLLIPNLGGGTAHGLPGILGVLAIDEDAAAQPHEPAQKGNILERGLGGDAAPFREDGPEHENVEFGLVVSDEDGGADGVEIVLGVFDREADTGAELHKQLEAAADCPLRHTAIPDEGENNRRSDTENGRSN